MKKTVLFIFIAISALVVNAQGPSGGGCGGNGGNGGGGFGNGFPIDTIIIATDTIISPMGDTLYFPGDTISFPFGGGNNGGFGGGSNGGFGGGGNGGCGGGSFGGGNGFPIDTFLIATDTMITPWGDTLWFPGDTITFPFGGGNNGGFGGGGNGGCGGGGFGGGSGFPIDTFFIATDTMITPWGDTLWIPGDTITFPFGGGNNGGFGGGGNGGCPWDTTTIGGNTATGTINSMLSTETVYAIIDDVTLYPNPVVNQINIDYTSSNNDLADIKIFSLNGKMVYTESIEITQGRNTLSYDVTHLPQGIYILTLSNGNSTQEIKLVK
ncbi:MAG: T9SS type A sorting domain-containing protein [Bacteroidales bacterium]|nr:T9SS type A sorting domain-containing protein [Bacteroidales bacterium]MCF8458929.1 T9SS type A sorting domain-containing protein [Bacteroidales bacterium]